MHIRLLTIVSVCLMLMNSGFSLHAMQQQMLLQQATEDAEKFCGEARALHHRSPLAQEMKREGSSSFVIPIHENQGFLLKNYCDNKNKRRCWCCLLGCSALTLVLLKKFTNDLVNQFEHEKESLL
jgi:hypothetical protein